MKRTILMITVSAIFMTTFITGAQAGDRGAHGVVLGGGTGAVIIGATVGGMIGLIVGSKIDRNHRGASYQVQRVFVPPPPPPKHYPRHPQVYENRYYYRELAYPVYRDRHTWKRSYNARKRHIPEGRTDHRR